MRKLLIAAAAALSLVLPATAALKTGERAPDFTAPGAMAGKPFTVNLKAALRKGPVVLYFFPAAFTEGCNAEAHAFAEALPDFQKAGASVIGMTAGNIDKLEAFSAEKCAGKFAVAAASPEIIRNYDVALTRPDGTATKITSRTSYVIAPDGKVLFVHSDMSPAGHIRLSLEAVQKYRAAHRR
ncbi:MAG: peroxiredoxin [Bradyrhizobium sp.]|jgi:thioredoxin-dependent peroxiredoxin|uniref:peroxiredoxin n=1 Tax=unclassified Sphingomonas TaxID=196159 RepID=UPI000A91B945|nr:MULTISPECIES: peroxiredoxin [unclassified Sphingomonas]MCP4615349.1 peroxiredoxin [Bradyrhizobium sp.]